MLKIYNSLTKNKDEFKPLQEGKISLYVCGNTVYDYCHLGHARSMIMFDVVVRYLRWRGYDVKHVRNITDIDDKIIKRANENGESADALAERFIAAQREDEQALNLLTPNAEPRATEFIKPIIELIEKIIEQGYGYVAENGDVCFDVRADKNYGKLSHRDIDKLRAGIRIEVSDKKRDPLDFVLWKMSKPGEPEWDSPWGKGRPGWHIECSAMSTSLLGQPFDIHGGGLDLKFPHHENEIAQSECAYDKGFANTWMHIGLLQINKEKMSKSLGNFFTIREILEKYDAEILRYFMIAGHYRSSVNYSESNMAQMQSALESFYIAIRGLPKADANAGEFKQAFIDAMDDDFNTPEALSVLFDMLHDINRLREKNEMDKAAGLAAALQEFASVFGIVQHDAEQFLRGDVDDAEAIEALIAQRNQARSDKNWSEADRIRDELTAMGITIEDSSGKTTWRRTG